MSGLQDAAEEEAVTQEQAREKLIELCEERGWWATHTALSEDNFDSKMDYRKMLAEWSRPELPGA